MDVVIANPICTDMEQQTLITTTHVVMMDIQEKTRSYTKQTLDDDFIPLAIETYECFHFYFNSFLSACA
jgi:hypothetical protein